MNAKNVNRRGFVKRFSGGIATMGAIPVLGAFQNAGKDPFQQAQVDIDYLKINDLKSVKLQFQGVTPRKCNSIIVSGGGPHGIPHMAIHLLASLDRSLIMETYPAVESQYNPVLPLYPVKDGYVTVPESPGLCIDPDPELL